MWKTISVHAEYMTKPSSPSLCCHLIYSAEDLLGESCEVKVSPWHHPEFEMAIKSLLFTEWVDVVEYVTLVHIIKFLPK